MTWGPRLNSTYANGLSGALAAYANATNDDAVQLIVNMPKELWLAVIYFAAYEIWQCNALALLNSVSVQQASVWSNLEDELPGMQCDRERQWRQCLDPHVAGILVAY